MIAAAIRTPNVLSMTNIVLHPHTNATSERERGPRLFVIPRPNGRAIATRSAIVLHFYEDCSGGKGLTEKTRDRCRVATSAESRDAAGGTALVRPVARGLWTKCLL